MAHIRPFSGIHYSRTHGFDFSNMIAPPFDVLDEAGKAALQGKHPNNIVTVDLPHLPPKTVGPDSAYEMAAVTLSAWLSAGVLERDARPALYPYMQTFEHSGRTFHRRGFFTLVRLSPFGQGQVIPHEKTYKEAIVDRLKLMRATGFQLSPIFGLFNDARSEVTNALYQNLGKPEISGTIDGIKSDLWSVIDGEVENRVIDLMSHKPVYIADGHHRYTTALEYQAEQIAANGGKPLPPQHPANFCMFSLVGMQDDGLLILPTHRMIGNLDFFDIRNFREAIAENFDISLTPVTPEYVGEYTDAGLPKMPPHTFGLYDGATKKTYELRLKNPALLAPYEPTHSDAWRQLDVAILQRYLIEEVLQAKFAVGNEIRKGYTADARTIPPQVDGKKYQIAFLLKSTPLHALEDLGKSNEVMPQKSTYFYPKLATGMMLNSLR